MPSRATPKSRKTAGEFLRRVREVYSLVAVTSLGDVWAGADTLIVGHRMAPRPPYLGHPTLLSNGMYLNVQIALQVIQKPVRLETTRATFTYQAGADRDDPRPIFEYHYDRDSRTGYPICHLHVYAAPQHYTPERPFSRLHLPTRRLTLEQIVWHLIQEHGVEPRRPNWRKVLWNHEQWFRDIQKEKDWPYDRPFDSPREKYT